MNKLLYLLFISFYSHFLWSQEIVITDADIQGDSTYTWTKDHTYILDGWVFLEEGGVLNIEAGTVIKGRQIPTSPEHDVSLLVIDRGAKINAIGTLEQPIIFTAEADDLSITNDLDENDTGLWGGLIVLGNAPILEKSRTTDDIDGFNTPGLGIYGGDDLDDNSGVLQYISIRHGGAAITLTDLISGLTLAGVGRGTVLSHIEVFASQNGGINLLGGAAQLKYIVSSFQLGNAFEYSHGWQGKGQFWFSINPKENGDKGGAFIGGETNNPDKFTKPIVSNATFLGADCSVNDPNIRINTEGLRFSEKTGGLFTNNIISGFKKAIEVEDLNDALDTRFRLENGDLVISNNIWFAFCEGEELNAGPNGIIDSDHDGDDPDAQFLINAFQAQGNIQVDPQMGCICRAKEKCLNPLLKPNSLALDFGIPVSDPFFDPVTFIGAFDHIDNWLSEWTALDAYHFLGGCNLASGQMVVDENSNCAKDTLENGLPGWLVAFQNETDTVFTNTDSIGQFMAHLEAGNYTIHLYPPNELWELCENDFSISVTDTTQIIIPPFVVNSRVDCPFLTVDISTPFLRRCFENTYQISYCNTGTVEAVDAQVQLTLDPLFNFISSTIDPSSQEGLVYTFPLGNLAVGACGHFSVTILVSCEAALGQSHCVEVTISPNESCEAPEPSPMIGIEGNCIDEAIEFTVTNIGAVDMTSTEQLIVIEDDVMFLNQPFQLPRAASLPVMIVPKGKTLRIEAPRVPGDPSQGIVSKTIEGCGLNDQGTFSTGFINQFPLEGNEAHESIDCQANIGSFDPNDKQGFPEGYQSEHKILPGTEISYLIRFQNTGTDTAFTVVIQDTLSPNFDLSTLRVGAASHDFDWKLHTNILQFQFHRINLPDSSVNEAASHGFFQFSVKPKKELPLKTMVFNKAGIYFDFNEPIITNQTFNTIDKDFIQIPSILTTFENKTFPYKFYPSPLSHQAILDLGNYAIQQGTFKVFNTLGQLLRTESFTGTRFEFNRKNLANGLYFFRVEEQGHPLINGQMILH